MILSPNDIEEKLIRLLFDAQDVTRIARVYPHTCNDYMDIFAKISEHLLEAVTTIQGKH